MKTLRPTDIRPHGKRRPLVSALQRAKLRTKRFFGGVLAAGIFTTSGALAAQDIYTPKSRKYNGGEEMSVQKSKDKSKSNTRIIDELVDSASWEMSQKGLNTPKNMQMLATLANALRTELGNAQKAELADMLDLYANAAEEHKDYDSAVDMIRDYAKAEGVMDIDKYPLVGVFTRFLVAYEEAADAKIFGWNGKLKNKDLLPVLVAAYYEAPAAEASKKAPLTQVPRREELMGPKKPKELTPQPAYEVPAEYVEGTTVDKMIENFEKQPTEAGMGAIFERLRYIEKKRDEVSTSTGAKDMAQVKEIDAEIDKINAWMKRLGVWKSGQGTWDGLNKIRAGMVALQSYYYGMSGDKNNLVTYLEGLEGVNPELASIYKRYVSGLDAAAGGLFVGLNPDSPKYLEHIKSRLDGLFAKYDLKRTQAQWFTDYYEGFNPETDGVGSPMELQAYGKLAQLEPLLAMPFARYLELIKSSGLGSEAERKLVVATAIKLYALEPLLVGKYFGAIETLAFVCEDNQVAFNDAMAKLSSRIVASTDSVLASTSPAQMLPMNTRRVVTYLSNSLDEVTQIHRGTLSQFDRDNLWDENLWVDPNIPHPIRGRGPAYIPRLNVGEDVPGTLGIPYPLANQQYPRLGDMMNAGSLGVNQTQYGGYLALPNLQPLNIDGGSLAQAMAVSSYLDPLHPFISLNRYLPGVNISPLSPTKLLRAIDQAFIPTEKPEFGGPVVAGGGGVGYKTYQPAEGEDWVHGGGGLGTFITPTGGYAFGGSVTEEEHILAGATVMAMPLGAVYEQTPGSAGETTGAGTIVPETTAVGVRGVESGNIGYEQLSDEHRELLAQAITTNWKNNGNPSQTLVAINWTEQPSETADGEEIEGSEAKETLLARYFYVEKDGTIYELVGGKNEFVHTLNFLALYGNQPFKGNAPMTYAANLEGEIERGGVAVAVDLDKVPVLSSFQAMPFWITEEDEKATQPLLLQWRAAFGATREKEGGEVTDIHRFSFPGQFLRLKREGDPAREDGYIEDEYFVQDGQWTMTRVRDNDDAWEITMGMGLGYTEKGEPANAAEAGKETIGRGGVFAKVKKPTYQFGGGAYFESGATKFEEIALMAEAEEARDYIENLHRVGALLYGSKQLERANSLTIGALAHGIEQIRTEFNTDTGQSETNHDVLLGRFVGLLLGADSAGRIDLSRMTGLEDLMTDYHSMSSEIQNNPAQAEHLLSQFEDKYADRVAQQFDKYSLGVQVKKDFSLEFFLMMREENNNWVEQTPDNMYGRMLYTWASEETGREGFWRAYAAVPMQGQYGSQESRVLGVAGTGVGTDLFSNMVLQRMAVDFGVLMATERSAVAAEPTWDMTAGGFAQGALRLFSNVVTDAQEYKKMEKEYTKYTELISRGQFSKVPKEILNAMCDDLEADPEKTVAPDIISTMRKGGDIYDENGMLNVTRLQAQHIQDSLWRVFSGKKAVLQERFEGNYRQYLAGGAYAIGEISAPEDVQWDIGLISEFFVGLATVRAYAIGAYREGEFGAYTGLDVAAGGWNVGAMANVTETKQGVAVSIGYTWDVDGTPWNISGVGTAHSTDIPQYARPLHTGWGSVASRPEVQALIVLTIGSQGLNVPPSMPMPGVMGSGNPSYQE